MMKMKQKKKMMMMTSSQQHCRRSNIGGVGGGPLEVGNEPTTQFVTKQHGPNEDDSERHHCVGIIIRMVPFLDSASSIRVNGHKMETHV
jgi:hypothetical protein